MRPQPKHSPIFCTPATTIGCKHEEWLDADCVNPGVPIKCPYGKHGERLWVKETHLPKQSGIIYRADFDPVEAAGLGSMYGGWKPSIFMRREFSRITLEITHLRIERLKAITPAGACYEGAAEILDRPIGDPLRAAAFERGEWIPDKDDPTGETGTFYAGSVEAFAALWESINGPGSWDANPWIWVVEFKRVESEAEK